MSRYSKTMLRKGVAKSRVAAKSSACNTSTSSPEEAMLLDDSSSTRIEHPAVGEWRLKVGGHGKRDA